jgi:hypothetical protein
MALLIFISRNISDMNKGRGSFLEDAKVKFLPWDESKKARENEKGQLVEKLFSEFLKNKGYDDIKLNQKVNGAEWDALDIVHEK